MRNNEYKKAFNQLNVSYKTIDNLYDITAQSKHKAITLPQKIIAMVMAFVLVVGGGFGISYSVSDKASMGIYVANANEVANIKKATPQDFTYQIYISEDNKNAMNKWQKDKQKLLDDAERLGNDNYTASVNSSSSNAANEKSGKKYDFYTLSSGNFTVNTGKIEDVKKYNVDVFVMGDDWKGKFDFLKDYCEVVYLPRTEGISTTQLKEELKG